MARRRLHWLEDVRFALVAMRAQKLRSFLTLLGVMAGVATVIMMVSFVVGFNNAVTDAFTRWGTQLVQFQKYEPRFGGGNGIPEEQRNRRDLTLEDAAALKRLAPLAAAVSPERYFGIGVEVKQGRLAANSPLVVGATPDYCAANNSARCIARTLDPFRDRRPPICIKQLASPLTTALTPARSIASIF